MALSKEWMRKIQKTRQFADFTFSIDGVTKQRVHTVILAACSPVFECFFEDHETGADLFDLLPDCEYDMAMRKQVEKSMGKVFAYCYSGEYLLPEDPSYENFESHMLPHLITLSLAARFQISGLVKDATQVFRENGEEWYYEDSDDERVRVALQKWDSKDFHESLCLCQHAVDILEEVFFDFFLREIDRFKEDSEHGKILDLLDAVPQAAVKMYSERLQVEKATKRQQKRLLGSE